MNKPIGAIRLIEAVWFLGMTVWFAWGVSKIVYKGVTDGVQG